MITVSQEPISSPDARRLLDELDVFLNSLYPPENNFLDLPAAHLDGQAGTFLVGREDGAAIGCGAVHRISETSAEIKRMYVRPVARGRGSGRRVLDELETWARRAGVFRLVLETGVLQTAAIALYEAAGFTRIACFGAYAGSSQSVCFEKHLVP